jgi:hypothetical protein
MQPRYLFAEVPRCVGKNQGGGPVPFVVFSQKPITNAGAMLIAGGPRFAEVECVVAVRCWTKTLATRKVAGKASTNAPTELGPLRLRLDPHGLR